MTSSARRTFLSAIPLLLGFAAPAVAGVVVYEHSDFRGESRRIDGEVRDLRDIGFQDRISSFRVEGGGAWEMCADAGFRGKCVVFDRDVRNLEGSGLNDAISSIRPARRVDTPPGRQPTGRREITLFERTGFRGESRRFDGPVDNLNERRFNDAAMSVTVDGGSWELCADADFHGRCEVIDRDVADLTDLGLERTVSSLRPADQRGRRLEGGWGAEITVFQHADFGGRRATVDRDVPDLRSLGIDEEISSVRAGRGSWELCEERFYRGRCVVVRGDVPNLREVGLNDSVSSIRRVRERERERDRRP